MTENCPIAGGNMPREIPDYCREHCESLWDEAVRLNRSHGNYDIYREVKDINVDEKCKHADTYLEYSSDGLQSVDNTAERIYTIVDQCTGCQAEYGEQSYQFNCPHNWQS